MSTDPFDDARPDPDDPPTPDFSITTTARRLPAPFDVIGSTPHVRDDTSTTFPTNCKPVATATEFSITPSREPALTRSNFPPRSLGDAYTGAGI